MQGGTLDLPPFAQELAHYEWVELALDVAEDEAPVYEAGADLLAGAPVLSPLARPLAYTWPVHRLGAAYQPAEPPALHRHFPGARPSVEAESGSWAVTLTAMALDRPESQVGCP